MVQDRKVVFGAKMGRIRNFRCLIAIPTKTFYGQPADVHVMKKKKLGKGLEQKLQKHLVQILEIVLYCSEIKAKTRTKPCQMSSGACCYVFYIVLIEFVISIRHCFSIVILKLVAPLECSIILINTKGCNVFISNDSA